MSDDDAAAKAGARARRLRTRTSLVLAAVFVAGAIVGGLAMRAAYDRALLRAAERRPEEGRADAIVWGLDHVIGLSSAQRERLRARLKAREPEVRAFMRSQAPAIDAIREHYDDDIRAELTPEQRDRFDRYVADLRERERAAGR